MAEFEHQEARCVTRIKHQPMTKVKVGLFIGSIDSKFRGNQALTDLGTKAKSNWASFIKGIRCAVGLKKCVET